MKRSLELFMMMLAVFVVFTSKVYATDLTDQITVSDSLNITQVEKSYDEANDVNELKITVTANEEIISRVLNHVAGNNNSPALLGRYYFEFNPNLDGTVLTFKKNNKEYTGTLADGIAAVTPTIAGETAVNYSRVWLVALNVQYFDTVSNTWKDVTNTSTGGKSVGQNLSELLGIPETSLVYGENFRFYMPEGTSKIYGWEIFENGVSTGKYEYLNVTYELNFPIAAILNNRGYYYPTLKGAIDSGSDDIVINEDLTLDGDITVPAGKTLIVSKDATLTIGENVTITFDEEANLDGEGLIEKKGKIMVGNKELFFVNVLDSENGTVAVDSDVALEGDEITITTNPSKGYELDSLKVVDATGKEVNITNGKFLLTSDVEVSATFKKVSTEDKVEEMPPQTSDINLSLIIGMIVLAGIGMILALRKRFVKGN